MLVASPALFSQAKAALGDAPVTLVDTIPYGDIWLRDTGPIFLRNEAGALDALCYTWNGWGEKYLYDHDPAVSVAVAEYVGAEAFRSDLIAEGGGLEVDGAGTCLTTRDCRQNPNRNPNLSEDEITRELIRTLGVTHVLWLDGALANDHTDGHIDTLARFVDVGRVACMEPTADDPNRDTLRAIHEALKGMKNARGQRLDVVTIPSAGRVENLDGAVMPASYANYYVANDAVFVPTYGVSADDAAVEAIGALYPTREAVGIPARAILTGGGALHCISREQPKEETT
jgi:agmatine deiminase